MVKVGGSLIVLRFMVKRRSTYTSHAYAGVLKLAHVLFKRLPPASGENLITKRIESDARADRVLPVEREPIKLKAQQYV